MELEGKAVQLNPCGINRHKLAEKIVKQFRALEARLTDFEDDIRALWIEFENLKEGELILGCRTKKEFCVQHLNRTPRAVRYMLNGGNENRDRDDGHVTEQRTGDALTGETVSPLRPLEISKPVLDPYNGETIDEGIKDFWRRESKRDARTLAGETVSPPFAPEIVKPVDPNSDEAIVEEIIGFWMREPKGNVGEFLQKDWDLTPDDIAEVTEMAREVYKSELQTVRQFSEELISIMQSIIRLSKNAEKTMPVVLKHRSSMLTINNQAVQLDSTIEVLRSISSLLK